MTLRTASRSRFGSRCFFAGAALSLACSVTAGCSEVSGPNSSPIDAGDGADGAAPADGGVTRDASAPPSHFEAGHEAGSEAATPAIDGAADDDDAGNPTDGGDDTDSSDGSTEPRPGALGATCSDSSGCQSGHCSESVCCDVACDGFAQACNRPGSVGTCTTVPVLHVDPITGNDRSKGLEGAPFRTLTRALPLATGVASVKTPWRVVLHDGRYTSANGEAWPAVVRAGVKVEAANTGKAVIVGPGPGGIWVDGETSVTGVGAMGFGGYSFRAINGPVDFVRVEVDGGAGVLFSNHAEGRFLNSNLRNVTSIGVEVSEGAKLVMSGGSIINGSLNTSCETSLGIKVDGSASLTMLDVFVGGWKGAGLSVQGSVLVDGSVFDGNGTTECGSAQITSLDGAILRVVGSQILNGKASGIDATATMEDWTQVHDSTLTNNYVGVTLRGNATLVMDGTKITGSFIGIYAPTAEDNVILALGKPPNPGNNVVRGSNRALVLMGAYNNELEVMDVHGNLWNPNVEGTDATGHYTLLTAVGHPQHAPGGNFYAPNVKFGM